MAPTDQERLIRFKAEARLPGKESLTAMLVAGITKPKPIPFTNRRAASHGHVECVQRKESVDSFAHGPTNNLMGTQVDEDGKLA